MVKIELVAYAKNNSIKTMKLETTLPLRISKLNNTGKGSEHSPSGTTTVFFGEESSHKLQIIYSSASHMFLGIKFGDSNSIGNIEVYPQVDRPALCYKVFNGVISNQVQLSDCHPKLPRSHYANATSNQRTQRIIPAPLQRHVMMCCPKHTEFAQKLFWNVANILNSF